MDKTVELKALHGVRNDVSLERFGPTDLAIGDNVDIDETGKVYRRLGTTRVAAGSMHSLKSFASGAYVVSSGALGSINAAGTFASLQSGIGHRVAYTEIAGEVFWSDSLQSGIIGAGANRKWGITVPALPSAVATIGDLRAGTYLYTLTYVRNGGSESGAPSVGSITVPANSGIVFGPIAASTDPTVAGIRLYVSTANGEVTYAAADVPNTVASVSVTALNHPVLPARTLDMAPPPAGQFLGYYNGRAYVGSGRFLWYSQPHEYELFDWVSGYLAFPAALKTFAPVSSGIFLGTETETMYLDGADPQEFVRRQVAPYGTVLGTEYYVRNDVLLDGKQPGMSPVWMSKTGLCLGEEGGTMQNLTSDRVIPPSGLLEGASLSKSRSGTPQLVTTLYS